MEINRSLIEKNQEAIRLRIEDYIEYDALVSQTEFASSVGIDPSGLIKMLKGQQKITVNTLKKISEATELRFEWLATGEGTEFKPKGEKETVISYTEGVPYYNVDFKLGFDEMEAPGSENPDFLIRMPGYEKATLWCNASGHSMEPEISNGDIIAMQLVEDPSFLLYGEVYGIITVNGLRTIKRLGKSSREGCYRLIPTNKDYDEQDIRREDIRFVYRVMGAMKSF